MDEIDQGFFKTQWGQFEINQGQFDIIWSPEAVN